MILLLYAATAALLLGLCRRLIVPISRAAALILFLLPFCMMGDALILQRVYAPIDFPYATEPLRELREAYGISEHYNGNLSDVASQMIPWRKAVQWSYARRQWPLHNPFILSGDILAAAAQPAAYSPFTLIACLLPVASSFTYSAAITFLIAALGAFLFGRELGCREAAALVASAGWMYSTDISFFLLWPLAATWAFLPFVLFGIRRAIRAPGVRSAAILTTAFVLMLVAGHPETALHVILLGALYAIFEIAMVRRDLLHVAITAVGAGIVALCLCAVYVLPVVDAVPQTEQHAFRRDVYARTHLGQSAANIAARWATDFWPFLHTRRWRVEQVNSVAYDTAAAGSIVLALAIYAIWRARAAQAWFFAGLALFCLLARVEWGPLARALQKLPLFDIALNERLSFGAAFAMSLLAAFGVEELMRRGRDNGAWVSSAIVLAILVIGTLVIVRANLVEPNSEQWGHYTIAAELGGLTLVVVLLALRVPPRWTAAAILGLVLVQRIVSERGIYPSLPQRAAYPPVPLFEPLRQIRDPFRIVGPNLVFIPGTSALYELEDARGYEAMTLLRYSETYRLWCEPEPVWFNRVQDLTKPFLSFLNVRFAIVWPDYAVPDGWRVFAAQRGSKLLENTRVIERAFVPRNVTVGLKEWEAVNEMANETDFRDRAWIRASGAVVRRTNGPGRVTTLTRGPLRYDMIAEMEREGWLVVSESAWKGWRAYVDGTRVQMQLANAAFLAVYVPAGHHKVKLIYKPDSFVTGRAVSAATLASILLFVVVRRARR